jgi:hypothetical protein
MSALSNPFFEHTTLFTPMSGLACSSLISASTIVKLGDPLEELQDPLGLLHGIGLIS